MAQQIIDIGAAPNDGTGDDLRTGGDKINDNFTELYALVAAAGAAWKDPVRAATSALGTLATSFENGDTIDGVVLATGDRILIKDQAAAEENGIYVVAASGAPARASDADAGAELVNAAVLVSEGTANADKLFVCTTNATITLGVTGLTWTDFTPSAVNYASTTEQLTGTESAKTATPDSIAALWEQGSDIASAGTISIGEGGLFHVTGTTTITDIDFATDRAGRSAILVFDGILTLTHHSTTLILPTGANITTAAGDTAIVVSEGSDNVRCVAYLRKNGQPLSLSGVSLDMASTVTQSGTPVATSVGFLGSPQISDHDGYTLALADSGGHYYHTSATPHTLTIPANGSIAFPIGTVIAIVNEDGAGDITLAITTDTLRWTDQVGSRTIAENGTATLIKVASDVWRLTGDGIT